MEVMSSAPLAHSSQQQLSRRALIVWSAAVIAYIVAITSRTSMGVAGVEALHHFDISASQLAVFTSVQVGVYALAQIPTGILIDRFGPRRMLVAGALAMAMGQILLGSTASYGVAVLARIIIGSADATAFLSVMRLLPAWIPLRVAPVFTQLTGSLGYVGQFISAVPFTFVLHHQGWSPAFISLGSLGALIAILTWLAVRDTPDPTAPSAAPASGSAASTDPTAPNSADRPSLGITLAKIVRTPACWVGFFIHYTLMSQILFTLLWGKPLMTLAMGLSETQASLILVINMVASVAVGPVMGIISARAGSRRVEVTLVAAVLTAVVWVWFFASGDPRGFVAVLVLNVLVPLMAPVANFGFDTVRENVSRRVVATATGLSNMGGFTACMVASQAVGFVLDSASSSRTADSVSMLAASPPATGGPATGGPAMSAVDAAGQAATSVAETVYSWGDFQQAWLIAAGTVWLVGVVGLVLSTLKMRRSTSTS